jgi:hypothetical protein
MTIKCQQTGIKVLTIPALAAVFSVFMLGACERSEQAETVKQADKGDASSVSTTAPPVVDITVRDFTIETPAEIDTGWTTFRLDNQGEQTHFVVFYRMPDGKTIADQKAEVVPVFDSVMAALDAGDIDVAAANERLGQEIPEWYFGVQFRGGPGMIAPDGTSETTILLDEPGTYLAECYVKGPDGTFHTSMGMLSEFRVVEGDNTASEPPANTDVTLSNSGIAMNRDVSAGQRTFRINFAEDPEGFLPYDVHLVRMHDGADRDALVQWMNWMNSEGLRDPAPVEFIGGAENTPAGRRAYVTVNLEPGRYAWISEIDAENMLVEFDVK